VKAPAEPITVIVAGAPVPKGRARTTKRGFMYTPAKTRANESHTRLAAQLAMNGKPPLDVPIRVEIFAELPVPQSWSGRRAAEAISGRIVPTTRPDTDNYAKSILDALNGIVLVDDAQVVELHAVKKFGVAPKLIATVFPIAAACSNERTRGPPTG
jgi:Holliday junction resolvase RusA-like endonuclease